jgi:hypothetical protein
MGLILGLVGSALTVYFGLYPSLSTVDSPSLAIAKPKSTDDSRPQLVAGTPHSAIEYSTLAEVAKVGHRSELLDWIMTNGNPAAVDVVGYRKGKDSFVVHKGESIDGHDLDIYRLEPQGVPPKQFHFEADVTEAFYVPISAYAEEAIAAWGQAGSAAILTFHIYMWTNKGYLDLTRNIDQGFGMGSFAVKDLDGDGWAELIVYNGCRPDEPRYTLYELDRSQLVFIESRTHLGLQSILDDEVGANPDTLTQRKASIFRNDDFHPPRGTKECELEIIGAAHLRA